MNKENSKKNKRLKVYQWLIYFVTFIYPSFALLGTTARPNEPDKPCEEPCCRVINNVIVYYCEIRSVQYFAKCILHCYRYQYASGFSNDNQGDITDETLMERRVECGTYSFSVPCCVLLRYEVSGSICEYPDACDKEAETYFNISLGGCETFPQCLPASYEYFY